MDRLRHWEEMQSYVGFDHEADGRLLRAALPAVKAELDAVTDHFYSAMKRYPEAMAVFKDDDQVDRLKKTMRVHIVEMLSGPWDLNFLDRRLRIGAVHVRVGLPERFVFTAMNLLRRDIIDIIRRSDTDDERRWQIAHSVTRITDLELAIMSSTYMEAHEQRRLRSLQDLIVHNLPVTVLCLDETGTVTSATHPSSRLFGSMAEVGRHYESFLPSDLIEESDLPTSVGRALHTGTTITIPRVSLGSGTTQRDFRITLVPLDHELARLLIHIEELTDVLAAEARVQQAEALARIGSMAAHLAHEIRNPLAAISATLQVIVASLPAKDRRRSILGKVQIQIHRLDRLVTDLLGYSRPAKPNLRIADLQVLARQAVSESGVDATLEIREAASVLVDVGHVCQVLVNLLQNARDSAGEDGTITVRVGPGPFVDVIDDGPGIAPEIAGRLFEPFVTNKTRGTGLGLAISRKLIAAMDGSVELVTADDQAAHPVATSSEGSECRGPGARFRVGLTQKRKPSHASPAGTEAHTD
jgi:signal transduction histidine kinase